MTYSPEKRHAYHIENKERDAARYHAYYLARRDTMREEYYRRDRELKATFIEVYGGKCACCGETEPAFLCVDHINGQVGKKKKDTGRQAYRQALKEHSPDKFRVLCHNCNSAVRWGRICPHQKGSKLEEN